MISMAAIAILLSASPFDDHILTVKAARVTATSFARLVRKDEDEEEAA